MTGSTIELAGEFQALGSVAALRAVLALLAGPAGRGELVLRSGLDEAAFGRAEARLLGLGLVIAEGEVLALESGFSARCRRYFLVTALGLRTEP